jgi:multidrug resistance protein
VALVTFTTFTDILAYSIAVPVLPDISRRFGASPTVIGVLFASFAVTVLLTAVPMGAVSDRTGRRAPLVGGLLLLAGSSALFAYAPALPWLFAARLAQGAADAITWVVGFALVADLYAADERGRMMGIVMSGSTIGFLVGPTIGGWLYQAGGPEMPYLVIAGLSLVCAAGLMAIRLAPPAARPQAAPLGRLLTKRAVAACAAAVVVGGGTIAMLEPVLSLYLADIGLGPAQIGLVFGAGAAVAALLHPLFGRLADRWGGRRLTLSGLAAIGAMLPILGFITGLANGMVFYAVLVFSFSMMVAPSLAYMAEAIADGGSESFGLAYGVYNFAWALGLLIGPPIGAALYERIGFEVTLWTWAPLVVAAAMVLFRFAPADGRRAAGA